MPRSIPGLHPGETIREDILNSLGMSAPKRLVSQRLGRTVSSVARVAPLADSALHLARGPKRHKKAPEHLRGAERIP
jgi:hypothetical protein